MKIERLPDESFAYIRPEREYPYRLFAHHTANGTLLKDQVLRHLQWLKVAERESAKDDYKNLHIVHYCLAHLYGHLSEISELGEKGEEK